MSDAFTGRKYLPPDPIEGEARPAPVKRQDMPDADRILHQITREAFAMSAEQRVLALGLLRAVRSWAAA
jgi:hypothetical protein